MPGALPASRAMRPRSVCVTQASERGLSPSSTSRSTSGGDVVALLVARVEGDGAVEQRDHGLEAAHLVHRAGARSRRASALDRKPSRSMWRPIDSRRQPSSRVMRSVCAPVIAASAALARFEHAQRGAGGVAAFAVLAGLLGAAAQELGLGAHDQVPVVLRQPLAHRGRGAAQRSAGCSRRCRRLRRRPARRSARARTRAATAAALGTPRGTSAVAQRQPLQPGQQRRATTGLRRRAGRA